MIQPARLPSLKAFILAALALLSLGGAAMAARPTDRAPSAVHVLTALPLFLGESTVADQLGDPDAKALVIRALEKDRSVVPIDVLEDAVLAHVRLLVLAQPRRLSPGELVALDTWVRGGGRVLIFSDPMLVWPSRHPLGDNRRPPPVGLLDPLFAHWGLRMTDARLPGKARDIRLLAGEKVQVARAGGWRKVGTASRCRVRDLLARCAIGKGRAFLIADADLLRDDLLTDQPATLDAIKRLLQQIDR